MSQKLVYRPEIDGLRAVAVIVVILYHAGIGTFSGGYVGVDVFFVISGYLITRLIKDGAVDGTITLLDFYTRRVRRIFPVLCLVVVASLIVGLIVLNPKALGDLSMSAFGVATLLSNLVFWLRDGYFEDATEFMPLIHTWSLSVEEQFYIVFPAMAFFVCRRRPTLLPWLLVILLAGSLFLSAVLTHFVSHPRLQSAAFFLLPTRMWELGAGALVAVVETRFRAVSSRVGESAAAVGLALIIVSVTVLDSHTPFPGLVAVAPVLGSVLFILFAGQHTVSGRLLGTKAFVSVGLISYSLYLWHQPIFALFRNYRNETQLDAFEVTALVLLATVLSAVSWKFVERPVRRRSYSNSLTIWAGVCVSAIIALAALPGFVIGFGYEAYLAKELSESEFVAMENMDDAQFNWARLAYANGDPDVIAVGSSRLMQFGAYTMEDKVLNLSSSGAYMSEILPVAAQAVVSYEPSVLILGVDPWLLGERSHRGRLDGQGIRRQYQTWSDLLESDEQKQIDLGNIPQVEAASDLQQQLYSIYETINLSDGGVDIAAAAGGRFLKARNGTIVYPARQKHKTVTDTEVESVLNYSYMSEYRLSKAYERELRNLVRFAKSRSVDVYFFLSPYHPLVFDEMVLSARHFLAVEQYVRTLAEEMSITVLGSFDPAPFGCVDQDFHDGMHPSARCIAQVLDTHRNLYRH